MRHVLILAVGLLAGCGSSVAPNGAATPVLKTDQVIVAHRGASGHAPEHTLAAYDLALQMGAEYIEQDVYSTADGVLVCLHDTTLNRTARGPAENLIKAHKLHLASDRTSCSKATRPSDREAVQNGHLAWHAAGPSESAC